LKEENLKAETNIRILYTHKEELESLEKKIEIAARQQLVLEKQLAFLSTSVQQQRQQRAQDDLDEEELADLFDVDVEMSGKMDKEYSEEELIEYW
jgi:hypothetical protein